MQERWHAGSHGLRRLEPVAALEDARIAGIVAGHEGEGGRAVGPFLPERFDFVVCGFELRLQRAPIAEDGGDLAGRTLLARNGQDVAHTPGQRVRDRVGGAAHRKAEAAEIVVHVLVAVPAAVIVLEMELQHRAVGEGDVGGGDEDGLAILIAAARASIDAPGGVLLAIDGEFDRAGDAPPVRLVVEVRLEHPLLVGVVSGGFGELDRKLVGWSVRVDCVHVKLGQRARSHERAAWPVGGQVGIGE